MSEPRITKAEKPEWGEFSDFGEMLAEAFALETNSEQEAWFDAYFPFFWSSGDEPSDGINGPPVSNPLEFRVILEDMNTNAAVTRHYALDEILRDDIAGHIGAGGKYVDAAGQAWAEKTAAALEALAREIREPL
jgi:hypothetical protein